MTIYIEIENEYQPDDYLDLGFMDLEDLNL